MKERAAFHGRQLYALDHPVNWIGERPDMTKVTALRTYSIYLME